MNPTRYRLMLRSIIAAALTITMLALLFEFRIGMASQQARDSLRAVRIDLQRAQTQGASLEGRADELVGLDQAREALSLSILESATQLRPVGAIDALRHRLVVDAPHEDAQLPDASTLLRLTFDVPLGDGDALLATLSRLVQAHPERPVQVAGCRVLRAAPPALMASCAIDWWWWQT